MTGAAWIFASVVAAGIGLALALHRGEPDVFAMYGDACSRLVGARMIVDSAAPGLGWLGTSWLPLPTLMLVPVSLHDALFRTGLAGLVVNLPLLAGSAAILAGLLRRMTGRPVASALAALVYALNPSQLYISLTAMTETAALFFVIAAIDRLHAWLAAPPDARRDRTLVLGCLALGAASLCRYETWPLALAVAGIVFAASLWEARPWESRARRAAAGSVALGGIALWLAWNAWMAGDPLHFARAEYYSAGWQARARPVRATLYWQLGPVADIYATTASAAFGRVFLAAGLVGAGLALWRRPRLPAAGPVGVLALLAAFTPLSLFAGVAEMTRWWNSRYVLLLAPLLAVGLGHVLAWGERRVGIRTAGVAVAAVFALTVYHQAAVQEDGLVTLSDARGGFHWKHTPHAVAMGRWLGGAHADGGSILMATGSAQAHRVMHSSGVALRRYVVVTNVDPDTPDLERIAATHAWILVGREPDPDGTRMAEYLLARRRDLEARYAVVHENAYYVLLRRLSAA